jgi:hypothetical protein
MVARDLSGLQLHWQGCSGRVVETEAYAIHADPACHTASLPGACEFVEKHAAGSEFSLAFLALNHAPVSVPPDKVRRFGKSRAWVGCSALACAGVSFTLPNMPARSSHRSRSASRWWFLGLALVGLVGITWLLAPMVLMNWVRGYLRQDSFRTKLEYLAGAKLAGTVQLAPLRWTGDEVTARAISLQTATGWKAEMTGLQVGLDWSAFRQRQWRLVQVGADSLDVTRTAPPAAAGRVPPAAEVEPQVEAAPGSSLPGWLRGWLPDRFAVDGARVDAFSLTHPGPWRLAGAKLRLSSWQQEDASTLLTVEGGVLETPVQLPTLLHPIKLNLDSATMRFSREDLRLSTARLIWSQGGEVSARGRLSPAEQRWELDTTLVGIPLQELLSPDWKLRLSGDIEGDLRIKSQSPAEPEVTGKVRLKNAVLTALPVLNQLATFTRVDRFKRLVLDIAQAQVSGSGQIRKFEKVVVQSAGLMRMEGDLTIQDSRLDGRFFFGVTPEALRWIPGAEQHVFTASRAGSPAGMVWTPLRISGTVDAPEEDLSERLLSAAGKAILNAPADLAGKTGETLLKPLLGENLAKKPGEVLKGASEAVTQPGEALKKAGHAAEKGLDLLKGIGGGLLGK